MAQPALDEDSSSSRVAAASDSDVTMGDAASAHHPSPAVPSPSGFQAVNARAAAASPGPGNVPATTLAPHSGGEIAAQRSPLQSSPTPNGAAVPSVADSRPATVLTKSPKQEDGNEGAAAAIATAASAASTAAIATAADGAIGDSAYGTRSRNRTNARPNYAEEQDMEFDYNTSVATTTSKKKATAASDNIAATTETDDKRDSAHSLAANNGAAGGTGTSSKDVAPSNTGLAAHQTSKKRKAGGAPAVSSPNAAANTPPPAAAAAARKAGAPLSTVSTAVQRDTNLMTFTKHRSCLTKKGELVADDGTRLCVNDHVYLVCEPAGDPYYLCRIMEFLHADGDNPSSPIDSIRVNWYYRPRDVQRFSIDSRLVYGTMHSDMCPITSLRGKCVIKHRSEIDDLDAYRKERDSFYFVQVYDRFIKRSYECIPIQQIINVPEKVKKALDERWKFVVVEIGRVKELTSAAKMCKRCTKYCASHDSVDCAICKNSYHMNCVQPPLPKKPSRGFAWACGPCSRASEKKMEARNTPTASGDATEAEEEEVAEEEDGPGLSNDTTRAPSPDEDDMVLDDHPATQAEIALAKMWPMRYLGIHARVEDALQYDDRAIYPRASSRLGPRHQANVNMWHGRPVELVKPAEIKKRYTKGSTQKKEAKLTKETLAAIEAEREEKAKRPKWVQDEPTGYIARGEDYDSNDPRCTAKLMFKMPADAATSSGAAQQDSAFLDDFIKRAKPLARSIGVPPFGTNFLDKALELLTANNYDVENALRQLARMDRARDLHEPVLTKNELIKFEEGVAKHGSEHRLVRMHMKTNLSHANIVRFYYLWKKTPKGREIWGNFGGRKKRKIESDAGAKLQAEVAHDIDDSAFDNDKAARKHRGFQCKFCNTLHSRQWRRAPGVAPGELAPVDKTVVKDKKEARPMLALCLRCAGLWRKYAIQWEEIDEAAKKVVQGGGRATKRRIDEELLREIRIANEAAASYVPPDASTSIPALDGGEPPKKKSKSEKPAPPPKEPTPPPPPIIPAQPQWKVLPCAVCKGSGDTVSCSHCKLTVHRRCFGLDENAGLRADGAVKWVCEQCQNDRNPQVSTEYACCLCLTEETQIDLVEPPRISHKKKTDREREKERMEKELADAMRADYRNKQLAKNRPLLPREPLKRTAGNNWVHVYCAVWSPEIRLSDAKALEVAEGFQTIPQARFETVCKLCKNKDHQNRVRSNAGACVSCFQCHANFHASCAFEAGYQFGFDVTPVKSSRKDQVVTATLNQETGSVTAAIWCKEHVVKSTIHPIDEISPESGKNALQIYVEKYKQADLTLTGTVRKANLAQQTKDKGQQAATPVPPSNRRESAAANSIAAAVRRGARTSAAADAKVETEESANDTASVAASTAPERRCIKCDVDITPRWHPITKESESGKLTSPVSRASITLNDITGPNANPAGDGARPPEATSTPNGRSHESGVNVRFMAPGATGRAWEGMPDRYGARSSAHSERMSLEAPAVLEPSRHSPDIDGGARPGFNVSDDAAFQSAPTDKQPLQDDSSKEESPTNFLCHKCFLKQKLGPASPHEERLDRSLDPLSRDRGGNPQKLPLNQAIDEQFRALDVPPSRLEQVGPAPKMNGYGHDGYAPGMHLPPGPGFEGYEGYPHEPLPMHPGHPYGPPPPPPPGYGPPPNYGGPPPNYELQPRFEHQPNFPPQPNGFHPQQGPPPPHAPHEGVPPQHGPPPPRGDGDNHAGPSGGHPMHERHNSYGYPPQQSPHGPYFHQHPPPGPMAPHPGQGGPNGMQSPHGGQHPSYPPPPSMQSQSYPPPPHQQLHLQPIGPPQHSGPNAPFGRANGQGPMLPAGSPPQTQPHPSNQPARPATPRSAGGAGGTANGNTTGASASPNLANLLH